MGTGKLYLNTVIRPVRFKSEAATHPGFKVDGRRLFVYHDSLTDESEPTLFCTSFPAISWAAEGVQASRHQAVRGSILSQVTVTELQDMLEHVPFVKVLDLQIEDVTDGSCRVRMPFHENLLQYYHIIHGGAIASLADSAMYFAQATLNGITKNTVTIEMKVNYLSPAQEEDLVAEGRVIKNGKKIIYGDVLITNKDGRQIAHATVTYMRLDYDMRE